MAENGPEHHPTTCQAREILERVADKWSLYVVSRLGAGPMRFTALKRGVEGISQRMLTVTLRGLERDGIVDRTIYSVMPPHVEYALTPLGASLLRAIEPLVEWSSQHLPLIDQARAAYDERLLAPPAVVGGPVVGGPVVGGPRGSVEEEREG
jgi:DNA-binding HxlR family transcriptional regulator